MFCPKCGAHTAVRDTVVNVEDNEIYRRRVCTKCNWDSYTVEYEVVRNPAFKQTWAKWHRAAAKRK